MKNAILVALAIGAVPVIVGAIYFGAQQFFGGDAVIDPGGALLLVMLGVSMAFGMAVILRGARDL